MNKLLLCVLDRILFLVVRVFILDTISLSEVQERRYNNDKEHTVKIRSWEAGVFLYNQARDREGLLQSKLAGILTILSILVGLFSLSVVMPTYSPCLIQYFLQCFCLVLVFSGIISAIGALSISTVVVPDLDDFSTPPSFDTKTRKEFEDAIIDMGCRSDFQADCVKISLVVIFISITLYILGFLFKPFFLHNLLLSI